MGVIALKIDVDTWRGTREGAPALAKLLERLDAPATFLFSLGPDHTGRALKRVFRPGFFGKVARTSVVEHYGLKTLMYGVLLPGPDIGRREAEGLRAIARAGFETGVHTWDHVRWQDNVAGAGEAWTRRELTLAVERYSEVFGARPSVHGAAGWQMNEAAYRLQKELGFSVASDGRGTQPYWPCDAQGEVIGPVQLPTTLPTLDELLGLDGWTVDNVHEALLARTREVAPLHVYTLHAELEGQKLTPVFERLLRGWREQGYRFATLGECAAYLQPARLPRCPVGLGTIPGRSGELVVQQPEFRAKARPAA